MQRKTKKMIGIFMCFGLGLLTGCAEKEIDYNIDDTIEQATMSVSLSQFADAEKWETELSVSPESGAFSSIRIAADVTTPLVEQMAIIEGEEAGFDAEFREQLIKSVFGDEEVYQEDGAEVSSYDIETVFGMRNGIVYRVDFTDNEEGTDTISMVPDNWSDVFPEGLEVTEGYPAFLCELEPVDTGEENQCRYTVDEAKKLAAAFMEAAGYTSLDCMEEYSLDWEGSYNTETEEYDRFQYGYEFHFFPEFEGVCYTEFGCYPTQAVLRVFDEGVVSMVIRNPMNVIRVTEGVALLPLETVQSIIINELLQNVDQFQFTPQNHAKYLIFDEMALIYLRVEDENEEAHFSYIPAWRLCRSNEYNDYDSEPVFINAMDGTVIHTSDWYFVYIEEDLQMQLRRL